MFLVAGRNRAARIFAYPFELFADGGPRSSADEIRELARLGCEYIPDRTRPRNSQSWLTQTARHTSSKANGISPEARPQRGASKSSTRSPTPRASASELHLCRGNNDGRWLSSGRAYESISKAGPSAARAIIPPSCSNMDRPPFPAAFEPLADLPPR